jgi:hypothetical protein
MSWVITGAPGTGDNLLYSQAGTPALDLRFASTKSLTDYVSGQNRVTFTRASSGTFVGSDGLIQTAASNTPRFDHNPATGESLGLLVEEARTNLLLNSATLSTQSVTVAAVANTLSFYGTGTVTLTGVSTAGPLVGTGANNRVSLTFTPTAGSLTLTVSGSVTNAQLEAGAFPTSYISTTTATVTRAADVPSITGANFSSWYNQTEGTFCVHSEVVTVSTRVSVGIQNSTGSESFNIFYDGTLHRCSGDSGGVNQFNLSAGIVSANTYSKMAGAYKLNDFAASSNGRSVVTDALGVPPVLPLDLNIGFFRAGFPAFLCGHISRLTYWPTRLANTTLQTITQ